jgi:hypothetical protein
MSSKKTLSLAVEKLYSKNTDEALFALNQIRNSGNITILHQLIEFLYSGNNSEVRKGIVNIFNDLKIQEATSVIISEIKNSTSSEIQKILLTSVWQSGLNYSQHLEFFVDLFISGSFEIAFEAFTIIDSMESGINAQMNETLIKKLKFSTSEISGDKAGLLVELVHVIEHMNID